MTLIQQIQTDEKLRTRIMLAIIGLGLINSFFFIYGQKLVVDSMQLVERGYLFTQGYLIPFGPRSTNTNMIYGSFISVFSGISLAIFQKPFGIGVMILLFQLWGVYLISRTKFVKENALFTLTYLALYWVSPWRTSEAFIWNVSLLFPTSCLFLYATDGLFKKDDKGFKYTFLLGLSYMITVQIHNSVIFFAPITLYFMFKKKIQLNWKAVAACVVVFILMMAPTVYMISLNPDILNYNTNTKKAHLFYNLVNLPEGIKGVAYWLRYPSLYFGSTTFQLPKIPFAEKTLGGQAWTSIKWFFGGTSILVVFYANYYFFKKEKPNWLKDFCKIALASLVLVSMMSPVPFNFWHLYLIYPMSLIPVAWFLSTRERSPIYLAILLTYFSIYSFIEARNSYKHSFDYGQNEKYERDVLQNRDALMQKHQDKMFRIF